MVNWKTLLSSRSKRNQEVSGLSRRRSLGSSRNLPSARKIAWRPEPKKIATLLNGASISSPGLVLPEKSGGSLWAFETLLRMCRLILPNSFQSWYLWEKSFSIDLVRRVKIVIPILKISFVIYERFKRHILCFELNTIKKYKVLERGLSKFFLFCFCFVFVLFCFVLFCFFCFVFWNSLFHWYKHNTCKLEESVWACIQLTQPSRNIDMINILYQ